MMQILIAFVNASGRLRSGGYVVGKTVVGKWKNTVFQVDWKDTILPLLFKNKIVDSSLIELIVGVTGAKAFAPYSRKLSILLILIMLEQHMP